MIVALTPYWLVNVGLRSESVGNDDDAIMLCCRPSAWPISCVITWRIVSPMSSSLMSSERASGLAAPVSMMQPVAVRPHVVVVPGDLAVDDLPGARIVRVRTGGVAHQAGGPAHDGVARIVRIEVRILRRRGRVLRDDRVLEAGLLEHLLPVLHALLHVRLPACRRGRVHVVHDRLHRLHQLAARVGRRILRLEAPARDERLAGRLLHVEAVVHAVHVK